MICTIHTEFKEREERPYKNVAAVIGVLQIL